MSAKDHKINKDYPMPDNLNRQDRKMFESFVNRGLNPHDYYDYANNKIKMLPPIPAEYQSKMRTLMKRVENSLDKLEEIVHNDSNIRN